MKFENPINIQAGYEAVTEKSLGESQKDYEDRIAKIITEFGPRETAEAEPDEYPTETPA